MIHALISAITCLVMALMGLPPALCLTPAAFYMGREFTQAEYRYIAAYCNGKRENMPWNAGILPAAWTVKGVLDWVLPLLVCAVACGVVAWLQ